MQAMGRKIGFIPAAARLADPERELPLQIYLPESPCGLAQMADQVNDELRRSGRCLVVVSEGFDVGDLGVLKDAFGHAAFGSSHTTVAQVVVNYLNHVGLATKGSARGNVAGTDQRHSMAYASAVDLDEAYRVGQKALELAAAGQTGFMATILREPGPIYNVRYDKVPLEVVANSERKFPAAWIAPDGLRRDRRLPPLRPAAGGRRHDLAAADRRPAADDAVSADVRGEETGGVCAAGGQEMRGRLQIAN